MVSTAAARLACHHAVQLNTRVARAYGVAREDDSHTSLTWDGQEQALVGEPFRVGAGPVLRLGLRLADVTLMLWPGSETSPQHLALDGLTLADAARWLAGFGIEADALSRPIHFELDDHPLLQGAAFVCRGNEAAFVELASRYSEAASALEDFRSVYGGSAVRCWPHHFDIATLVNVPGGTIGAGMSPGDRSYPEPYYYISPWPYPEVARLPLLDGPGHWHTDGWVGAVLGAGTEIEVVRGFLDAAFEALKVA